MATDQDWENDFDDDVEEKDGTEMSFLDHLEELRWHIMRSIAAILVFTIAAWIFRNEIFGTIIMGPTKVDFATNLVLNGLSKNRGKNGQEFYTAFVRSRDLSQRFVFVGEKPDDGITLVSVEDSGPPSEIVVVLKKGAEVGRVKFDQAAIAAAAQQIGIGGDGRAQHVAGRNLRDAIFLANKSGLSAFARARCAQQNESHLYPFNKRVSGRLACREPSSLQE